jgi:methyl-accepting chemotaxis protein/methyl-accepting chemotaxis protein-1 (serine sensor receptor)
MNQWTIGRKLFTAIGAICFVLATLGTAGIMTASHLNADVDELTDVTAEVLYLAGQVQYHVADLISATRMTVVSAALGDAKAIAKEIEENEQEFKTLEATADKLAATARVERIRELAREVKSAMAEWHTEALEAEHLAAALKVSDAAAANAKATPYGIKAEELTNEILSLQREHLGEVRTDAGNSYARTRALLIGLCLFAAVIAGVVIWVVRGITFVLRESVTELSQGAQQVATASGQVSGAAQTLSQGSTEQAAALEETSASMEEMASMTRKNAENSQQASAMMAETDRRVATATAELTEMVTSMSAIKDSSDKVARIIKTIDEIAFQTNILALNAAVEAARAGEAGMGFAVVADEVRALAQRSAQAARDTTALIEESIAKSNDGHQRVRAVSGAIESISAGTATLKGLIDEVTEASRQQAHGIDQVSQATAQMEKVTQATAATAEESAAASEELNAQAESSMYVVRKLAAMVGYTAKSDASTARRSAAPVAERLSLPRVA